MFGHGVPFATVFICSSYETIFIVTVAWCLYGVLWLFGEEDGAHVGNVGGSKSRG